MINKMLGEDVPRSQPSFNWSMSGHSSSRSESIQMKMPSRSQSDRENFNNEIEYGLNGIAVKVLSPGRGHANTLKGTPEAKTKDGSQQKYVKRYDEKNASVYDEQEAFLERVGIREDISKSSLLKYYILKKVYRFCIFAIIIAVVLNFRYVINWLMAVNANHSEPWGSHELEIKASSCYIYLQRTEMTTSELNVKLEAHEFVFTPYIIFSRKRVLHSYSRNGQVSQFTVTHDYSDYSCEIEINWPKNTKLDRLKIDCEQCTLLAKKTVDIGTLELRGNIVNTNFKNLNIDKIDVDIKSGVVQINEASLGSDSTVHIVNGTFLLQTRTDIRMELVSFTDSFCFSAPYTSGVAGVTCATQTITDELIAKLYNMTSYNKCTGVVDLCTTAGCTPPKKISLTNLVGSVYGNVLDDPASVSVSQNINIASGDVFNGPVNFTRGDYALLINRLSRADNSNTLPLILKVDIGNFKGESSSSSKWILTEYPLTSVYDPWTISGITFGIFTWNFQELRFSLYPGFCPHRPTHSRKQYASIKSLLQTIATEVLSDSVYTGVVLEKDDPFLNQNSNDQVTTIASGIYQPNYVDDPQIYDIASKFGSNIEEAIFSPPTREYNNLNISSYIEYIVAIPCGICLYFLCKWWCDWTKQIRRRRFLSHSMNPNILTKEERSEYHSYLNMESKEKDFDASVVYDQDDRQISLSLPTFNLYVEMLMWQVFNKISNSLDHFYEIVFEEKTIDEIYDNEMIDGSGNQYNMDIIKEYYQQFCYWNLFEEEDMYSPQNIKRLHKKGYKIVDTDEEAPVLKKLLLKKNISVQVISEMSVNDYKSSLHSFIELVCVQTNYDSDEVDLALFAENYEIFCNLFGLELATLDLNILKKEFNIDSFKKKVNLIERIAKPTDINPRAVSKKTKFYKLNLFKIVEYLNMLKGYSFSDKLSDKEKVELIKKLIFPQGWYLLDFMVGLSVFIILYVLFFFYMEHSESKAIMLSNFKRIPEIERLRDFNPFTVEGDMSRNSNYTAPMNNIKILQYVLFYAFLFINVLAVLLGKDIFNYYNANRNRILNLSNYFIAVIQWSLLFISISVFLWSITQYLIGTIIYSLLKIYALLPYVFSTLCFVFFIWLFIYNARKNTIKLEEKIRSDLKVLLINRYVERLRHASSYNTEMQNIEQLKETFNQSSIQGINEPLSDEEVTFTVGQVMAELKEICMFKDNWKIFIEAVLLGDKQRIQTALAGVVEAEPLNLPQGSLELLGQILTIDENMESPELFINVISSTLLKIMITNEKIFLKDLWLKELETYKICNCADETCIDKNLVCRGCRDSKEHPLNRSMYEKNRTQIFKLALEKNTYIFLLLISLMDLIKKKNTGKILDILINQILPEGLASPDKETTACLMRFAYQAFFEIDQNFSRADWAKTINDIMLNFFGHEQNSLQLINILEEGNCDNAFDLTMNYIDATDTVNSIKRCICNNTDYNIQKQTNSISNFLSIAAIFLCKEPALPDKLLKDIHQIVNKNSKIQISQEVLNIIFNFLMFSRETPKSIFAKISVNAQKYFLDRELSDTIKDVKSIASGISKEIKTKDYQNLENSALVVQIKNAMNLQPYEMLGFIYLINDKVDNDEVSKFFHHLFTINSFQKHERTLLDIISIALSKDSYKISKSFSQLKLKYPKVLLYLRGVISFNTLQEKNGKHLTELLNELPLDPTQIPEARKLLVKCLERYDLSPFFQTLAPKNDSSLEVSMDNIKWRNMRMLELVWTLNSDEKLTDVLIKFKFLFRELDDPAFFSFAMKIYTVLEYVLKRSKLMMDSTLSKTRAVKVLADLILTKVDNVQKFLDLFVTERVDEFIEAFCHFNEACQIIKETNYKSLKNHIQYIDKSIQFLKAQIDFYSSNPIDPLASRGGKRDFKKEGEEDLAVIIIKKIMMPEIKLKHRQIMLLLDAIVRKIFNTEDGLGGQQQVRIMTFFTALFVYVLGDQTADLGEYFDKEHGEQFIRTLVHCRGYKSKTQRINAFFEDQHFHKKDTISTTLFLYLILFLRGALNRDEFNLQEKMELTICQDLGIHRELFDYLDVYIHRNVLKFKNMLMKVHWKIIKELSSHNSIKKEDVDWDKLYENILSVMADKQPNLNFFSELLKVPHSKLNFVYILNNLRNSSKVDKVLQEANSSSSFKQIVESINVDHGELIQIIKICLNKAGFECLDILLKKMKLQDQDQIDISMLMSLITIDAKLMIDADETRSLFKRMNLYSKLFKRMKIDRALSWAFIRIIKGDMYSFRKFLTSADTDIPANHKKFLNIVVGLCGCKNSPYVYMNRESQMSMLDVVKKYNNLAQGYRKKKENSKESAQIMLYEQLGVHPVWGIIEDQVSMKVRNNNNTPIISVTRVFSMREEHAPLTMFHFQIMSRILNASLPSLEIFVNLSFLHNVHTALMSMRIADNDQASQALEELKLYYKAKFQEAKVVFRKHSLEKKFMSFEYNKSFSEYWMFYDITSHTENTDAQEIYYQMVNPILLDHWKDTHYRMRSGIPEFQTEDGEKVDFFNVLENEYKNKSLYTAFECCNPGQNAPIKDNKLYIEFLDSIVDCILKKMKELNGYLLKQQINPNDFIQANKYISDPDDYSVDDNRQGAGEGYSFDDERLEDMGGKFQAEDRSRSDNEQDSDKGEAEIAEDEEIYHSDHQKGNSTPPGKFYSDGIIEFCLYVNLMRLKRSSMSSYEEKVKEMDADFNRIDSLFSIVEKMSVFSKNFGGFRKQKYMTLFSFSQGMILSAGKNQRSKYSLYNPELCLYSSLISEKLYKGCNIEGDFEYPFDKREFLGTIHTIKRLLDYDLFHLNQLSPFAFQSFDFKASHEHPPEGLNISIDLKANEYYFAPAFLNMPLETEKDLAILGQQSLKLPLHNILKGMVNWNPTHLSLYMLKLDMYSFTSDPYRWNDNQKRLELVSNVQPLATPLELQGRIEKLKNVYFLKHNGSTVVEEIDIKPIKPDFEKNLERIIPCCFFLNDLAQGHYKVLSETRNIFSDVVEYSKYQKIYEAILRLHHLAMTYDERSLKESLDILAPHLYSDRHKIAAIMDYILNTNKSSRIGKDLDFQNNQISELLFLFNNNKSTILAWVKSYLSEFALPSQYIGIIMALLGMYLKMIGEKYQPAANFDEFNLITKFLMNNEAKSSSLKYKLAKAMFKIIDPVDKKASQDPAEVGKSHAEIYRTLTEMMSNNHPITIQEEQVALILEIANDVLEKKFKMLNNISEDVESVLKNQFGVNNSNLLNIFKLIDWLTNKKDTASDAEIEKHFFEFLNYGNFDLMNLNIEKIKLLLLFLKNFNRADVTGILQFLRDLQLTREYVYIFSRYIWITTLNKNFDEEKKIHQKLNCSISVLNWYAFLEIVIYEIEKNQPSLEAIVPGIKSMRSKFTLSISKIPFEKIFVIVDKNFDKSSQEKLLSLLKGESFINFTGEIMKNLQNYTEITSNQELVLAIYRLSALFFFSMKFFKDDEKPNIDRKTSVMHLEALIDYDITMYLNLMEYQGQNQKLIQELFDAQQQFSKAEIDKKFHDIFTQNKIINPIRFENTKQNEVEMKRWDNLINAGKSIWFIKYYVLQIKQCKGAKLEDFKSQYQKIFMRFFKVFLVHAVKDIEANKTKKNQSGQQDKKSTTKYDAMLNKVKDGLPLTEFEKLLEVEYNEMEKIKKDKEDQYRRDYKNMVTRMINLFLDMKFKKSYNSIFHDLINFLVKDVFKSNNHRDKDDKRVQTDLLDKKPGDKEDKIIEAAKKINVESFFELYDNIYENKNIFNRNAENILRLSLNTLKNFPMKNINKVATSLVKVCRGSIGDLEDLLKDLLIRNDRVAFAMSQIRWCDQFIKANALRKKAFEHRKVNSRLKGGSNVRFLSEMSSADQLLFIHNLKDKPGLFFEVIPFFEAHLSSDSSFYSKYDTFKLLKRMGFDMSIHRLNEIVSESTETRRGILNSTSTSTPDQLTREEVKCCLLTIEKRIVQKVTEMKRANLKNVMLYGIISATIAYFTIRVYMVFLRNLWIYGDQYSSFVACIPILIFTLVIGFFFVGPSGSDRDTGQQIREACTLLFSNFN